MNKLKNPYWRLNNLYTIIDTRAHACTFKMNEAQKFVYTEVLKHNRQIILKSRQQGISTLFLVKFFDLVIFNSNFKVGLMAQGQQEASKLLQRTKTLWNCFPPVLKKLLNLNILIDNNNEITLTNNSSIYIATSFRSATLNALHISELAHIANKYPQRAREVLKGSLQALHHDAPCIFESTAEGNNIFKELCDIAHTNKSTSEKDFKLIFLSWLKDPKCNIKELQPATAEDEAYFKTLNLTQSQKNFYIAQKRILGHDFHSEYPATYEEAFKVNTAGTYYNSVFLHYRNTNVKSNLYDINYPVYAAVDFGMRHYMVLLFFQLKDDKIHIIREYVGTGNALSHYLDKLIGVKGIILPHDAEVRDLIAGVTRLSEFNRYGYYTVVLPKTEISAGISEVLRHLPNILIDTSCPYLLSCIENYKKEIKQNDYVEIPKQDKFTDGADTLRYIVMGHTRFLQQHSQPYISIGI